MTDDSARAPRESLVTRALGMLALYNTDRTLALGLRLPLDELLELRANPDTATAHTRMLIGAVLRDNPHWETVAGTGYDLMQQGIAMFRATLGPKLAAAHAAGADIDEMRRIQTEELVRAVGPDALKLDDD